MFNIPPPTSFQNLEHVTLRSVTLPGRLLLSERQTPLLRRWANQSTFNQMVHFETIKAILATANLGNICREPLRLPLTSDPPIVDRDDEDLGSTTEGGFSDGCCGRDDHKENTWLKPVDKCRQII